MFNITCNFKATMYLYIKKRRKSNKRRFYCSIVLFFLIYLSIITHILYVSATTVKPPASNCVGCPKSSTTALTCQPCLALWCWQHILRVLWVPRGVSEQCWWYFCPAGGGHCSQGVLLAQYGVHGPQRCLRGVARVLTARIQGSSALQQYDDCYCVTCYCVQLFQLVLKNQL